MPACVLTSLSLFRKYPPKKQNHPVRPDSHSYSLPSVIRISGNPLTTLQRLFIIIIGAAIFSVLPTGNSSAEMNLPGMQIPTGNTASFDRKESVLDRFRDFSGKKDRSALEALFTRWDTVFRQDPAVLLSDGVTVARITLRLSGRGGEPPIFSISGGHCVSAQMTDAGLWILEILPNRGSLATSVTVYFAGRMTEYPLTVAPPLHLFDQRNVDARVIDYVTIANQLAAPRTDPGRK